MYLQGVKSRISTQEREAGSFVPSSLFGSKCGLLFGSLKSLIQFCLCTLCPLDGGAQVNDTYNWNTDPDAFGPASCESGAVLVLPECLQTVGLRARLGLQPFLSPAVARLLLSSLLPCLRAWIISFRSLITIPVGMIVSI